MLFETPFGSLSCVPRTLIVAGWTGRNRAAVDHHIEELAAIGVAPPSEVPLFYRCSANLLTQDARLQVLDMDTSGEAEPFLLKTDGKTWLGLASDQTDRALEAHSVAHSKQICGKPVASKLWDFDAVAGHLDEIQLRSWIHENGNWTLYQDGTLASILPLNDLMTATSMADGSAMLCGTLSAIGGVRPANDFKMALHDPVLNQTIEWTYSLELLPAVS